MRENIKISDWCLIGLLAILLLLYTGLWIGGVRSSGAEPVVENRKTEAYNDARIPAIEAGGNININTADAALLDTLPGIGETLARRIVAHRETHGAFPHPACLTEVEGIGEKTYAELVGLICVE